MTDSVESVLQKSREEFEKCAVDKGYSSFDFNRGDLQAGWLFWQASRSALEPMLAEREKLRDLLRELADRVEHEGDLVHVKAGMRFRPAWCLKCRADEALSPSPTPRVIELSPNDQKAVLDMLANPPEPNEALKRAAKPSPDSATLAQSGTIFVCVHGSFPNPCRICHGQHTDFATTDPNEDATKGERG